jgi:hypothetical protein
MTPQSDLQRPLHSDSPKVFFALARFLNPDELGLLEDDYLRVRHQGGNIEPFAQREAGVSYNPRLARILSILVHDLAVRDLRTLRTALYAALILKTCEHTPLGNTKGRWSEIVNQHDSAGVIELLSQLEHSMCRDPVSAMIAGALVLDNVRHLHQSRSTVAERREVLQGAQQWVRAIELCGASRDLMLKLRHAITLQQRRVDADSVAT